MADVIATQNAFENMALNVHQPVEIENVVIPIVGEIRRDHFYVVIQVEDSEPTDPWNPPISPTPKPLLWGLPSKIVLAKMDDPAGCRGWSKYRLLAMSRYLSHFIRCDPNIIMLDSLIATCLTPAFCTVARALISEGIRSEAIKASVPTHTNLDVGSSVLEMTAEEPISKEPLSKEPFQERAPLNEVVLDQGELNQSIVNARRTASEHLLDIGIDKTIEADTFVQHDVFILRDDRNLFPEIAPNTSVIKTFDQAKVMSEDTALGLLDIGIDKTIEADTLVQHDIFILRDDRNLFPEIAPNTSVIKTFDQAKVISEDTTLGQALRTDIPVEPILTEQIPPIEDTGAFIGTGVGDLSELEQFKFKISDFCQRITDPRASTYSPESPIIQLKARHSSSPSGLVKPTFIPEEIQELREILQCFSKLDFETLAEKSLKTQLAICCRAAWVLKPAYQHLHKQLLTKVYEFQKKAHQLHEVQERQLQRQSLKVALLSAEDETQSLISSYDQETVKLHQLRVEETQLEEALPVVRREIAQTTSNLEASMNKASSSVASMRSLEDQLQRTTDQEEFYEFICNKGSHIMNDLKDTIVQFLSSE